jgi:hypothetical protein
MAAESGARGGDMQVDGKDVWGAAILHMNLFSSKSETQLISAAAAPQLQLWHSCNAENERCSRTLVMEMAGCIQLGECINFQGGVVECHSAR